jgi:hypothetical protein
VHCRDNREHQVAASCPVGKQRRVQGVDLVVVMRQTGKSREREWNKQTSGDRTGGDRNVCFCSSVGTSQPFDITEFIVQLFWISWCDFHSGGTTVPSQARTAPAQNTACRIVHTSSRSSTNAQHLTFSASAATGSPTMPSFRKQPCCCG